MPFPSHTAAEVSRRIQERKRGDVAIGASRVKYSAKEYEEDVEELLTHLFPFSTISGLRIFNPARRGDSDFGFEIDNLVHIRRGGSDFILVVEAKKQKVNVQGDRWLVNYDTGPKCAKNQVENHIRTLWEYLEPVAHGTDLRFVAVIASLEQGEAVADGVRGSKIHLCPIDKLAHLLRRTFGFEDKAAGEVLRVTQSDFLNLLRLNLPVAELGHPELGNAIRYVERCRRTLDENLFRDFQPTAERWAINGSAGMGKSVLLAYTAAVLSSGYEIKESPMGAFPVAAEDRLATCGFSRTHGEGEICLMAMSAKQLENLRSWFRMFQEKFLSLDLSGDLRFRQPIFQLCRDATSVSTASARCAALLVDEAHDLPPFAALEISKGHLKHGFFLVVACDRHQKLRLAGADAKIIEGLDFNLKSKRLKQIYRNPAPIYVASIALMFRWLATEGPKVIPTKKELQDCFGLEVDSSSDSWMWLSIKSDAHPANSWCHTVATFPNAQAAYLTLINESLKPAEVLWVRFTEEDPDFDYERLRAFTYHNCRSHDAHKLSDKYVKGQEFPVVVIEGFPSFMDRFGGERAQENEDKVWTFRREVYLCASRATCFLYFVCNPQSDTEENLRIRSEIQAVVRSVSMPSNPATGGTRSWKLHLHVPTTQMRRNLDVFDDARTAVSGEGPEKLEESVSQQETDRDQRAKEPAPANKMEMRVLQLDAPISVKELAAKLGVRPFVLIKQLMELQVFANLNQTIELDTIKRLCEMNEVTFERTESALDAALPKEAEEKADQVPVDLISASEEKSSHPESSHERKVTTEVANIERASAFRHSITIDRPTSVMDLARLLGVQHREIVNHAVRLGIYTRGSTLLDNRTIKAIAAKHGFAVVFDEDEKTLARIAAALSK